MNVIEIDHVSRAYRGSTALDDFTASVRTDSITGILGRNGAGKSTLMRILTGLEVPSSGEVRVFGQRPYENAHVVERIVHVRESQACPDVSLRRWLEAASWFYPNWDAALADRLVKDFDLPCKRAIKKFSRGMRSAAGIVVGIASRADLTILDEPYAGLDPVARQLFYDRLLEDYAEHPRTIVLSTHLIDEIADLLEDVLVIDRGRLAISGTAEDLRTRGLRLSGPSAAVAEATAGHTAVGRRSLSGRDVAVLTTTPDPSVLDRARARGVEVEHLSLQELVVATLGESATSRSTS